MTTQTKPSYYGAYFWVATISSIVPLFVAAKAFHEILLTAKPDPTRTHPAWTTISGTTY